MEGSTNDGSRHGYHDRSDHIPGHIVTVLPRQDVGSRIIDPGCDGGNNIGGRNHSLRSDFPSSIALGSVSRSFYSCYHTVHCMRVSACKRTQ